MKKNLNHASEQGISSLGKIDAALIPVRHACAPAEYHQAIIAKFNPEEVKYSALDLESGTMVEIEATILGMENKNLIAKVFYEKPAEKIILEFYNGQILIEHNFWPDDVGLLSGMGVLNQFLQTIPAVKLMIGFEISIFAHRIESCWLDCISDHSMYPILTAERLGSSRTYIKSAYGQNDTIGRAAMAVLQGYASGLEPWSQPMTES
jgi:hypothetical protein